MNELKVFYIIRPRKYRAFIPEGRYGYIKANGGLPAMRAKWEVPVLKGAFFKTTYRDFVFAQHAIRIAPISADNAKWARSPGSFGQPKARHIPGVIGIAAITANLIRGALTDTTGLGGLVFQYESNDGQSGLCMATAPMACVEEILASVPPGQIDFSIAPN